MALSKLINLKPNNRRDFLTASGKIFLTMLAGSLVQHDAFSMSENAAVTPTPDQQALKTLLADKKKPLVWLFTGDSITHGVKHTHGERSYPEIFQERVRYEIGRYRDIVFNTGISGHTTDNLLQDFDWRVAHFKPSVVSIMLGTNDCAKQRVKPESYYQNLKTLIYKIRNFGGIPIIHTPNTIIWEKSPERITLPEYVQIILKVANEDNLVLVDNYKHWQEADQLTVHKQWLNDPLHPNGTGHKQIAQQLFKSLDIFDPKDPTCGAPYYEGEH